MPYGGETWTMLFLFDIAGTLLRPTPPPHRLALCAAAASVFGVQVAPPDLGQTAGMLNPTRRSRLATMATRELPAAEAIAAAEIRPEEIPPHRQDPVLPYLSSARAGWDGLIAEAYCEPLQFEGLLRPVMPHCSLTLFTGGPMYLEWREVRGHGSWTGVTLRHGDLILRPTNLVLYELRGWSLSATPTHTFTLYLSLQALAQTAEQVEVGGTDPSRLTLIERAGFQDPLLLQLALAVRRELAEGAPSGRLFADCVGQLLALHLLRHYTTLGDRPIALPAPHAPHTLTAQQLQCVLACINDQPGQALTLEALAQQTGYSPHHFCRLFRQTMGESPHQFVLRRRLEHAQQLLATTEVPLMPLADVAAACGFADQSAFTRAFKRALGVTPGAYRRQHQRASCVRCAQNRANGQDGQVRCAVASRWRPQDGPHRFPPRAN